MSDQVNTDGADALRLYEDLALIADALPDDATRERFAKLVQHIVCHPSTKVHATVTGWYRSAGYEPCDECETKGRNCRVHSKPGRPGVSIHDDEKAEI